MNRAIAKLRGSILSCSPGKFSSSFNFCRQSLSGFSKNLQLIPRAERYGVLQISSKPIHYSCVSFHYDKVDLSKENCIFFDDFKAGVQNDQIQVVDVRRQDEVDKGRVPAKRFIHVHVEELEEALNELSNEEFKEKHGAEKPDKNASDIVFFCRLGIRSSRAVKIAKEAGYKSPRHYPGGWAVWNERIHSDPQ
uniref:rhodanese domain-containing protein CG4456-like n=1 Tax=Styela clava TaxID=7725 RepID=UPI00193A4A1F|nr:rhodanese domain-containing protein CG4456-like [Styela clava]XP_039250941.1 rhodanese domain-containing protein CG4456-like [Styela clava]